MDKKLRVDKVEKLGTFPILVSRVKCLPDGQYKLLPEKLPYETCGPNHILVTCYETVNDDVDGIFHSCPNPFNKVSMTYYKKYEKSIVRCLSKVHFDNANNWISTEH